MFVKPAADRVVRRPDTLVHLLPEGEHVPDGDEFWVRRLRDGDVELAEKPAVEGEQNAADGFFEIGKHVEPVAHTPDPPPVPETPPAEETVA